MADQIATRDAYGQALTQLGAQNANVVVFDADLSSATKTNMFQQAFPERHFNAGIAEMNMTGLAAGMSVCGKIPFISTFAVFGTGRNYDMVRNAICYSNLNVKLAMTHAGLTVGEDGATHQMLEDIALMNVLPNMRVFVPADAAEAAQMVFAAAEIEGPVYLRFGRAKCDVIYGDEYRFVPGKANVLKDGAHVTLAACGIMVAEALKAAGILKRQGIDAAVVNFSTLKPFDADTLVAYAKKTGAVVTCEEHSVIGGLGSIVCAALAQRCPAPVKQIGIKDVFGESGEPQALLKKYGLTADDIAAAAAQLVKG